MLEVNANLMGASGVWPTLDKRVASKLFPNFEAGPGFLAVLRVHAHQAELGWMGSERGIDVPLRSGRRAGEERDVGLDRFADAELVDELNEDWLGLREQDDAASLEVEAMGVRKVGKIPILCPRLAL